MNNLPLHKALQTYLDRDRSRLHMPGHKGVPIQTIGDAAKWDVTELPDTDSLFEASGALRQLEDLYRDFYHTADSFLSAGGSTLCIQGMLAAVHRRCLRTGKQPIIAAGRNIHQAAVNAMALLGIDVHWIAMDSSAGAGLPGRVSPESVEALLNEAPEIQAVYITSPDYYGVLSDIPAISAVCRAHHIPLLVDNAHGAHLACYTPSLHPIALGADLCCDSLHKMLPALTGSAVLHCARDEFSGDIKGCMSLFGSTSPNYLIMLSADSCIEYLQTDACRDFKEAADRAQALRLQAAAAGCGLPLGDCDPMHFSLDLSPFFASEAEIRAHLEQYQIEAEYINDRWAVLLLSPLLKERDWERLRQMLDSLPAPKAPAPDDYPRLVPKKVMPLRDAFFAPSCVMSVENSAGKICACAKSPCPPGVPLAMFGEEIDPAMIKIFKKYGIHEISVIQ